MFQKPNLRVENFKQLSQYAIDQINLIKYGKSERQMNTFDIHRARGVQPFGISGPHWKKSCLGSHIKYIVTCNHKKHLMF